LIFNKKNDIIYIQNKGKVKYMDELIEEIIKIVATEDNDYIRKYDLRHVIEDYTEREVDRRVDMYIEEEKEESWNLGYAAGKREAIETMRDNFDDMLYNL
jgi:preprotein translocase subunit SecA